MQIKDLIAILETEAPPSYQESYDNSGLIVGDPTTEVQSVLLSLDCTEEVVAEAISKGCNVIVSHHPIVFKGLKRLNGKSYVERTVLDAIKNDIALYAIHTNLDHVFTGVNAKICEKLGVKNYRILAPKSEELLKLVTYAPIADADRVKSAMFEAGAGQIGNYSECSFSVEGKGSFKAGDLANPYVGVKDERHVEAEERIELILPTHKEFHVVNALKKVHLYEEVAYYITGLKNTNQYVGAGMVGELEHEMDEMDFLKFLKEKMKTSCVRYTALRGKKVKRVAVCGGAGSFLLGNAKAAKADVFITGDFKYHEFFDAEKQLIIADIGHYESEQFTNELLIELLKEKNVKFAVYLSQINTNPINYL